MKTWEQSDRKILHLLQKNSREKLESIAFDTGLSVATVQRRIKHFRAVGIIERETALISQDAAGYNMTFLIFVEMEQEKSHQLDLFRKKILAEAQVQQCYYITGEADLLWWSWEKMWKIMNISHVVYFLRTVTLSVFVLL